MKLFYKIFTLTISISLFLNQFYAQNLIPNAGFEYNKGCPTDKNHFIVLALGWYNGSYATPDYYNPCGEKPFRTPKNRYGYQKPYNGKCYVGLNNRRFYREYIRTRLIAPLKAGVTYTARIFVSSSDTFSYLPSDIGLYFSKKVIYQKGTKPLLVTPQIISNDSTIIPPHKWTEISGEFIAKGGEKFVTIGSFRKNPKIAPTKENINLADKNTYIFIDNPSTTPLIRTKHKLPKKGEIKTLDFVLFQFDKATLLAASFDELNKLAKLLLSNKNIKIEIIGHTDDTGTEEHNQELSKKRAIAVLNYLLQKGVDKNNITAIGMGSKSPRVTNDSEKDRQINRRVEFKVVE